MKDSKNKKSNRLGVFGIIAVVVVMAIVLMKGVDAKERELAELRAKEERLKEEYQHEIDRASELEEKRIYVKTKKYVEDVAKQFGLVYPDEIIYKPTK